MRTVDAATIQRKHRAGIVSLALNIGLASTSSSMPASSGDEGVLLAFEQKNMERARNIFAKLIPTSYAVSAFFLCYAAVNADECVRIVGGRSFQDAAGVFAIMAFLPIIHNYSMLSGSVLYAAHRPHLRNIGLVTTPLSIAATFFLVGPKDTVDWISVPAASPSSGGVRIHRE